MKSVQAIINDNINEYEQFAYYELLIEKINKNVSLNPDIAIESCKSLIEGIAKTMLKTLDNDYSDAELDKYELSPLIKELLNRLSEFNDQIEEDFVRRTCSLVHSVGIIRNQRGDISHGKLAPKEINSTLGFANFVHRITEGLVYYILEEFYDIELSDRGILDYEDRKMLEYNNMLDEEFEMPGKLYYSKALYEQDYPSYEQGYDEFVELNKGNE